MTSFARSPLARIGALVVLAAVGLFQAFWHLGRANINPDEGIYLTAGREYIRGIFTFNREHPPTAKYLYGLAQEYLGDSLTSGRIAAATVALLAGFAILLWLWRELGPWWALLATGFWWLLPRAVTETGIKIDRFAILEPFMVSFAIMAVALGWWWFRRPHWWNAALAGALMALSVTSKVSTAFLVLTFLYLTIRALVQDHRVGRFVIGLLSYAIAFAAVTIASWAPMNMITAIKYMISFQAAQKIGGHNVIVAGHTVTHPPWWANLWFTEQGLGFWLTIALCLAAVFAFLPRPSELSIYLLVAGVVLVIFYCGIAGNALPSYYYVWIWILFLLAVIGLRALWNIRLRRRNAPARHGDGSAGSARWILRPLAALILVVALVSAGTTTAAIAGVQRTGFGRTAAVLHAHGVTQIDILATGYASWEYTPYLRPNVKGSLVTNNKAAFAPATYTGTVVALRTDDRIVYDRALDHFVEANRSRFTHIVVDNVDLYLPKGGATVVQTGETFRFGKESRY